MLKRGKLLGPFVTLVCLGLAFYRVDVAALYGALAGASYVLVAPAALCTLAGYLLRTARWRVILAEAAACRFATLFSVLMIGFATNNVLPARLGEFARAYLLRRRTGTRKTFVLASIFIERMFDGLVLVGVLAGLSAFVDLPGWGREVELVAGLLFLGVVAVVVALLTQGALVERLFTLALSPVPERPAAWATAAFASFLAGLSTLRRPSVLVRAAGLSAAVWSLEWGSYFVLAAAFDLGLTMAERAAACALLLAVVNLGIMLPAAPGYVGTFQVFAVAALGAFGVGREVALAMAIVAHLMQYVLVTAIGLALLAREHISLHSLSSDATRDADPEPALSSGTS